ncbi:MAG: hypothetical protein ACFFCZ_24595 [Promethearchaeota archaeon]
MSCLVRGIDIQSMRAIACRQSGIIRCGEGGPAARVPLVPHGVQVGV